MGYAIDRVMLFDKDDKPLGELAPSEVLSRRRHEEINGTHTLTIETQRVLVVGTRVITQDGTGKIREHVVSEPDEEHSSGEHATGTYVCMWSLQYDLSTVYADEHAEPGMGTNRRDATYALMCALDGTDRWGVGAVDVPSVAQNKGCVMMFGSAFDRLSQVVDTWGGEVDAHIEVNGTRIVSRVVELRAHLGSSTVTRRFDWGRDLTSIRRTPDPGPYFCRVVPLGKTHNEYAEDDETEISWPLRLTDDPDVYPEYEENWIQDDEAALAFRVPDGNGGWEYPTKVVKYDADDVGLLYEACDEDLHNHTRPGVTYEANVLQFAAAGMDARGVSLGDDVHCVDRGFNPGSALRLEGRVVATDVDELSPRTGTDLTIGQLGTGLNGAITNALKYAMGSVTGRLDHIEGSGAIAYVETLLSDINAVINVTGGHVYYVDGEGLITYDIAVDDPLVGYNSTTGTWASRVTQVKGGSIRFANTKRSGFSGINDWNWTNVITADGYLGLAATIARITAGYIGSVSGAFYLDMDNNALQIGDSATLDGRTVASVLNNLDNAVTAANYMSFSTSTGLSIGYQGTSAKMRVDGSGFKVIDGNGDNAAVIGLYNGNPYFRVGQNDSGHIRGGGDGYFQLRNGSSTFVQLGRTDSNEAFHYRFGSRENDDTYTFDNGNHSVSGLTTLGDRSFTVGTRNAATGDYAFAVGNHAKAVGDYAIAMGHLALAIGDNTTAIGEGVVCAKDEFTGGMAVGRYNAIAAIYVSGDPKIMFCVGCGTSDSNRRNAFTAYSDQSCIVWGTFESKKDISTPKNVRATGSMYATSFVNSSDRRLKDHIAYLSEGESTDFVRSLKPALFTMKRDGSRKVGFYAQDVQGSDLWDTSTVVDGGQETEEGFVPLALDYSALVAPLVSCVQGLTRRVEELEARIDELESRS